MFIVFKSHKRGEDVIRKLKKIEESAAEIVECFEETMDERIKEGYEQDYDDDYYYRHGEGGSEPSYKGGRYGYRRR